jgi:hypothetical protein
LVALCGADPADRPVDLAAKAIVLGTKRCKEAPRDVREVAEFLLEGAFRGNVLGEAIAAINQP